MQLSATLRGGYYKIIDGAKLGSRSRSNHNRIARPFPSTTTNSSLERKADKYQ